MRPLLLAKSRTSGSCNGIRVNGRGPLRSSLASVFRRRRWMCFCFCFASPETRRRRRNCASKEFFAPDRAISPDRQWQAIWLYADPPDSPCAPAVDTVRHKPVCSAFESIELGSHTARAKTKPILATLSGWIRRGGQKKGRHSFTRSWTLRPVSQRYISTSNHFLAGTRSSP